MLNYYLLTQTASLMKSNQKMFMKHFSNTNICLTLAIFQRTLSFMIIKMKWSLAKRKMNTNEFQSIFCWIKITNALYAFR